MVILIAEAKTMKIQEKEFSTTELCLNTPVGLDEATKVMVRIASLEIEDIAETVKISINMARQLKRMACEFTDRHYGNKAIEAFTGVVFRNLDYYTLSPDEQELCMKSVCIISSLYGLLHSDDIIKPYRLEYTTLLSPSDQPMWKSLKEPVTKALREHIATSGDNEILDLLPADASKCIDWNELNKVANVAKIEFLDTEGIKVKSPHAGKLKALRGQLLRHIIKNKITTLAEVATIETDTFLPAESLDSNRISFLI